MRLPCGGRQLPNYTSPQQLAGTLNALDMVTFPEKYGSKRWRRER